MSVLFYYSEDKKGRLIKDGGEGYIYELRNNLDFLMKIYKEVDSSGSPVITPELQSKLDYMKNNPPYTLVSKGVVAWPIELLDDEHGQFVGFVMPKLGIDEHLQRVYTYRHPHLDSSDYDKFPSVKSRISIAINLCSALHELHKRGYVIGDFNHANIGVNYTAGQIYFVDCDSFHITDNFGNIFRTNVIMAGYLAPEIIKHCNDERAAGKPYHLDEVSLPTFTKESDLFCLAIHIFKLLMNGVDPFRGVKSDATGSTASPFVGNDAIERNAYVFREGNKPSAVFCPPADSLPTEILSLFDKAFIDGRIEPMMRPNAEDWYNALNRYLTNEIENCENNPKHQYYKALHECPYCAADDRHMTEQGVTSIPGVSDKDNNKKHREPVKDKNGVIFFDYVFYILLAVLGLLFITIIISSIVTMFGSDNGEKSEVAVDDFAIEAKLDFAELMRLPAAYEILNENGVTSAPFVPDKDNNKKHREDAILFTDFSEWQQFIILHGYSLVDIEMNAGLDINFFENDFFVERALAAIYCFEYSGGQKHIVDSVRRKGDDLEIEVSHYLPTPEMIVTQAFNLYYIMLAIGAEDVANVDHVVVNITEMNRRGEDIYSKTK